MRGDRALRAVASGVTSAEPEVRARDGPILEACDLCVVELVALARAEDDVRWWTWDGRGAGSNLVVVAHDGALTVVCSPDLARQDWRAQVRALPAPRRTLGARHLPGGRPRCGGRDWGALWFLGVGRWDSCWCERCREEVPAGGWGLILFGLTRYVGSSRESRRRRSDRG